MAAHLENGAREFNRGRWWHAHEEWEREWKTLQGARREYLQALIQAAGAFHLLERGRADAARRVARAARARLRRTLPLARGFGRRVSVPGLARVVARLATGPAPASWRTKARALRARVVGDPRGRAREIVVEP
jgi:predicted metal-dependent hydrolase